MNFGIGARLPRGRIVCFAPEECFNFYQPDATTESVSNIHSHCILFRECSTFQVQARPAPPFHSLSVALAGLLFGSIKPTARAPAPAAPPTSTSSFLASIAARRQPRTLRCHAYWILWHSRTILCGAYKKILVWDPPKTPEKVISKFNRHCRNVLLKDGSCILLPRLTFLPPEDEQKKRGLFKRHLSNV